MSSEQLNGTCLETEPTSMPLIVEMFIQQLLEYVGQISDGPVSFQETRKLPNLPTTDIILTGSCVRNSDTGQIMVGSLTLLLNNQSSQSELLWTFSQSILALSQHINDGSNM